MEAVQIQLSPLLVQQIEQASPGKNLGQVIVEAVQLWLEKQRQDRPGAAQALQMLRERGLIMTADEQRKMAETIMSKLSIQELPDRALVASWLGRLDPPLSVEIIQMRGER